MSRRTEWEGLLRTRNPFIQRQNASQWIARMTFTVIKGIQENHLSSAPSVNSSRTPVRQGGDNAIGAFVGVNTDRHAFCRCDQPKIVDQIHIHERRYVKFLAAAL